MPRKARIDVPGAQRHIMVRGIRKATSNMNRIIIIVASACLFTTVVFAKEPAKGILLNTIQVLKIAAQDERAVIKTPDGKTQIIKPGDSLGTNGNVTEIAVDRVVIEEKNGDVTEKVIIRLINGKQKIERMKKNGEQSPAILAPTEKDLKPRNK